MKKKNVVNRQANHALRQREKADPYKSKYSILLKEYKKKNKCDRRGFLCNY